MWYKAALEYMGKGVEANLTASQLRIDKPVVMVAGEEDVVGRVEGVRFAERVGVAKVSEKRGEGERGVRLMCVGISAGCQGREFEGGGTLDDVGGGGGDVCDFEWDGEEGDGWG